MHKAKFGTHNAQEIEKYTLENQFAQISILNLGGIIQAIKMPDKNGKVEDIVLGFDNVQDYIKHPYLSGVIGRCANRINNGKLDINGVNTQLQINNDKHHLHGGKMGFDRQVWEVLEMEKRSDETRVLLKYLSPEGEEGYPGNLTVTVEYLLNNKNELIVDYKANTDKTTIINLTNHPTFNLNGNAKRDILNHSVQIHSKQYLETNEAFIPTGNFIQTKNTYLDLEKATILLEKLEEFDESAKSYFGYDHCYNFNNESKELIKMAEVKSLDSGRKMEVFSTEPALQFYTGNGLNGFNGKEHIPYHTHFGLCLEPQHFPDSPNHPRFPSTLLNPSETYTSQTIYRFAVD